MAKGHVPDFASIVRAQPLPRMMPLGVTAGIPLAHALAGISQSITENKLAKQSMKSFAEIMSETDPQAGKIYETMADSIPLFDPDAASGGGGGYARGAGSTGGGPKIGGMQGMVMADMMDALRSTRDVAAFSQKQAIAFKFDAAMEGMRHSNDLLEMAAAHENSLALRDRMTIDQQIVAEYKQKLKDQAPLTAAEVERARQANIRIVQAQQGLQQEEEKITISRQNAASTATRAAAYTADTLNDIMNPKSKAPPKTTMEAIIGRTPALYKAYQRAQAKLRDPLTEPEERAAARSEIDEVEFEANRIMGTQTPLLAPDPVQTASSILQGVFD